jgi:glycosyltransferase involved in cell wall biosynthesis
MPEDIERMLDAITPVILTWNEAPNIGRTLACLDWAREIVVVDSGSSDATVAILKANPRVRLHVRKFDTHQKQWRFATEETGIASPWLLRLDADYLLPHALIEEISRLDPGAPENGYRIGFDYAVYGHVLTASLYPANTILLRRGSFAVHDAGHTESWEVMGPVGRLNARIVHDDWKAMSHWVSAQADYMTRELHAKKRSHRPLRDWLRRHPPLMPIAVFFYCLFVKGLIFNGRQGILYTLQRTVAEAIYALLYLEARFRTASDKPPGEP